MNKAAEVLVTCKEEGVRFPQLVAEYEAQRAGIGVEEVREEMRRVLSVMRESVQAGLTSRGEFAHIVKGYGYTLGEALKEGRLVGGTVMEKAMVYSIAVSQHNASLGRVVACPTAGSCGVVPGALLPLAEEMKVSDEVMIEALLVMAGVGTISAAQGPISGAEGGCQAEVGVASAMAAGALVYLLGGDLEQVFSAAAIAMQCLLGLVCDPIAGLVEAPCVIRNSTGALNALSAANIVMAGIPSVVPFDETVLAMKAIGKAMPEALRETSGGGLAVCPTAKRIYKELKSQYEKDDSL